ncbi:MAG: glycosyltransferase [Candidatus Omnitrophica bacterium]|nr:glycosyltransferase [Candidatus Omnitrophota bacterium]MDD5488621.1 glycosyltransferase [Candidatus Omnitrophota bacterium]
MSFNEHKLGVKEHFDNVAVEYDKWKKKNWYYHRSLIDFVRKHVAPGSSVLEVGCATGDIIAATEPARGVGIDLSDRMIELAQSKYPDKSIEFISSPIEELGLDEKFDYIIMVDLLDHVYDVANVLRSVHRYCKPTTKLLITTINPWWSPVLDFMEKIGAKMPEGPHNFVEQRNLARIIEYLDYAISYTGYLLLFPKKIPLLSYLANTIGVKTWLLNKFSFVHYAVLRATPEDRTDLGMGCSVVIPCYNEEGNIAEAVKRVPRMGKYTEIIVVDDGSNDRTAGITRALEGEVEGLRLITYSPNHGKGYAVKAGFDAAAQEVVMILDADMTVMPEELPEFFDLLNKGKCGFVNGTRMVYPMAQQSMRFLNLLGNKVFGLILTYLTGQHITDTLCGTKALYKKDYLRIEMGRDKWGDFDLLFGAVHNGSKIIEVPVHYQARRAGVSKMKTLQHGLHLMRVCFRGFTELVLGLKP